MTEPDEVVSPRPFPEKVVDLAFRCFDGDMFSAAASLLGSPPAGDLHGILHVVSEEPTQPSSNKE